jgi:hypothetical protein
MIRNLQGRRRARTRGPTNFNDAISGGYAARRRRAPTAPTLNAASARATWLWREPMAMRLALQVPLALQMRPPSKVPPTVE